MNYLPSSSSDKRMTIDLERTRVRAESRILVAFVPLDESLNVTGLRINSDAVDCWKWAICNYSVCFVLLCLRLKFTSTTQVTGFVFYIEKSEYYVNFLKIL